MVRVLILRLGGNLIMDKLDLNFDLGTNNLIEDYINLSKSRNTNRNLIMSARVDREELRRYSVFLYILDVLVYKRNINFVREILKRSGVDLQKLKRRVLSIDEDKRGIAFRNLYRSSEDMFYEDVASVIADMSVKNDYIEETILEMGKNDNKYAIDIVDDFLDMYSSNEKFYEDIFKKMDNDENFEITEDTEKYFVRLRSSISKFDSLLLKDMGSSESKSLFGNLERIGYMYLYYLNNDKYDINGKRFMPDSCMCDFYEWLNSMKEDDKEGFYSLVATIMDKKIDWLDGKSIYNSRYVQRYVDRCTKDMSNYLREISSREESASKIITNYFMLLYHSKVCVPQFSKFGKSANLNLSEGFIRKYYTKEFYAYWYREVFNRESISKLDVNKYMPERDLNSDYESIMSLIASVGIIDMYEELYDRVIKNSEIFEELNTVSYSDASRAWDEVITLREELKSAKRTISNEESKYLKLLKDYTNKKSSGDSKEESHVISMYKKGLNSKEEEIKRLQATIDSQKEFMELMEQGEQEDVSECSTSLEDISSLQSKTFLIVSRNFALNNAIKKVLPNSKFVDSYAYKCNQSHYDGVVLAIGSIGHPLYFKVVNNYKGSTTPMYAYTGYNVGKLCKYLASDMRGDKMCYEIGSTCKRIN